MNGNQQLPLPAKLPGDHAHLQRLIANWANDPKTNAGVRRLQGLVGSVVIVGMLEGLADDSGRPQVAFKGGRALELRFGLQARASGDLDAAYRGTIEEVIAKIVKAGEDGWQGFTGTVGPQEEITRPGITPAPVRVKFKLAYKNKPFVTVPLELSAAEGRSLDSPEIEPLGISLAVIQITGPTTAPFLPVRYQIAQKFHACTEIPTEGSNRRFHDLRDLLLIRELAVKPEDQPNIAAACREIFEGRAKQHWPPEVRIWPEWESGWSNLTETEGVDMTLGEAVEQVSAWIAELAAIPM